MEVKKQFQNQKFTRKHDFIVVFVFKQWIKEIYQCLEPRMKLQKERKENILYQQILRTNYKLSFVIYGES